MQEENFKTRNKKLKISSQAEKGNSGIPFFGV